MQGSSAENDLLRFVSSKNYSGYIVAKGKLSVIRENEDRSLDSSWDQGSGHTRSRIQELGTEYDNVGERR